MLDVIYDGQCGFCVRSLRICRALDVRGQLRFHDANARQMISARFPELAGADFEHAMFSVTADRSVHRGFFAFRQVALESPLMWIALPVLYAPGSGWLGPKIYGWVARNRRRFGCESEVCELPPANRSRPLL
jgi:predicted DCC family thiol-disulfide oxidoreductase YuxK